MTTLLFVTATSSLLCLLLTPIVRTLARRVGLVDRPDRGRKLHTHATPTAGGLALLVAITCAVGAAFLIPNPLSEHLHSQPLPLAGLLLASAVICGVGVVDDWIALRARHKLLGQVLAVGILVSSGLEVRHLHLFGCQVELGVLALPLTMFWLLGAINSLNLIDGMDGMLSSVGLIIAVALGAGALLGGHWVAACVAFALAGALAAFLRYNFPPASIFLGDSGSMLVGLLLGALAIQGALKAPATVALAAPLAILTVPVFDTAMAILRRKLTGRNLSSTDRGHLHHCLLRRGFTRGRVLLIVALISSLAAVGGLISLWCSNDLVALLVTGAVAGIFVTTRLFGHAEFLLLKQRLALILAPLFGKRMKNKNCEMQVRLQGSRRWEELWGWLVLGAGQFSLSEVILDVNAPGLHEGYYASWRLPGHEPGRLGVWQSEIPLYAKGQAVGCVKISGQQHEHGEAFWEKIAAVAVLINYTLPVITEGDAAPSGLLSELPPRRERVTEGVFRDGSPQGEDSPEAKEEVEWDQVGAL